MQLTKTESIRTKDLPLLGVLLLLGGLLIGVIAVPLLAQITHASEQASGTPSASIANYSNGYSQMSGGMMNMMGGGMMGDADRSFIEQMIPHHQDAIDMANLALQKAQQPE